MSHGPETEDPQARRLSCRCMATVGVFAAIFDEDRRILCVRRAYPPHNWTLPGGRVELGESPIEALLREVHEETGFVVEAGELIGVYAAPFKDDLVLFFECTVLSRTGGVPTARSRRSPSWPPTPCRVTCRCEPQHASQMRRWRARRGARVHGRIGHQRPGTLTRHHCRPALSVRGGVLNSVRSPPPDAPYSNCESSAPLSHNGSGTCAPCGDPASAPGRHWLRYVCPSASTLLTSAQPSQGGAHVAGGVDG